MNIYLDSTNREIIVFNSTKDSDKLFALIGNTLTHLFSMYTYKMSRNDIRINFNAFDIPEENHKVFTATEYINRHNITFEG